MSEINVMHPLFDRLSIYSKFETFWEIYPRKIKFVESFYAFADAAKKVNPEDILAALIAQTTYAASLDVPFLWKPPLAWLEQECWKEINILEENNGK